MPLRLGTVLSPSDFPTPELTALVAELPPRLIAEQHTAAWVWGVVADPPYLHEVCVDITARVRPTLDARLSVREVVVLHEDVAVVAGLTVTTPMRTAIDLTRFVEDWSDEEARIVRELLALGECDILDCARVMNRKRNLPGKRIALERLSGCVPATSRN